MDRPKSNLSYANTVVYEGRKYGVWLCGDLKDDYLYIDDIIEEKCDRIISINMEDLNENYKYIKNTNLKGHLEQMKYFFNEGRVFFNNIDTKKYFYEYIKLV